ncbi:hypothetical protein MARPO_0073s0099 [Marchantia polymorpha]|uniref:Uncharacterized protein n=1 Tax=Marchantia polymorpha TaxID=3197 RepID=A0A2R6WN12_MARPO|nr:hypothetical protein MARPO_0073s0099 [Marchantia polymorpha]|eukprot:PTQ35235.1 hypothetical protein MARPO_0073s0099 [Marchantia polymorpha]
MAPSSNVVFMLILTTLVFSHGQASANGETITEKIQHGFTDVGESDAALTATREKIVEGLKTVTDMSDQLRVATQKINIFNAPQQGAVIASGFATIIQKVSEGIVRVDRVTSGPLPDADAQLVVDALTTFVQVHQALLNVVIGKHGILTMIPFFEPIRMSLVSLEAVIDRLRST